MMRINGTFIPRGTLFPRPGGLPGQAPEPAIRQPAGRQDGSAQTVTDDGRQSQAPGNGGEGRHLVQAEAGNSFLAAKGSDGEQLSRAEMLLVARLQQVDLKVRAHEMAHLAAAGAYARGGASFRYQRGPDGKSYAVAGEVPIDTGKEATPEKTIAKMRTVRAAALAPADPSPQDRQVAARAGMVIAEASQELRLIQLAQARERVTAVSGQENAAKEPAVEDGQAAQAAASGGAPVTEKQGGTPPEEPGSLVSIVV